MRSSPPKRFFDAAVEEIRDMRVFLGLGAAEIFQVLLGEDLRQDVRNFFRRDHVAQPRPGLVVLRHGDIAEICRPLRIGKFLETRLGDGARHLARAVGAEIEENHGVVIANRSNRRGRRCGARCNHDRIDEFIGDATFVAAADGLDRIGGFHRGIAVNHGAIGALDALPAVVAIHRVVAAGERCDAPAANLADFLLQLLDVFDAAVRRSVATVHEAVDEDALDVMFTRHPKKRVEVLHVRVHAAVAE